MSTIFNRGTLKLVLALIIPIVIVWAFVYSQHQATVEVKKFKEEQQANPTANQVTVSNYELKEVDDSNHIRWQLLASEGTADQSNQGVMLKEVKVEYFDGPTVKMCLHAPQGLANETNRYVKLSGSEDNPVLAEGEAGKSRLSAKVVELTKKNQFVASGGVNIVWPEVAKVTGLSASGTIDGSELGNLRIVGNTHAEIVVK
ncbi:MAG: hypothetical protein HY711_10705 [Candidatus Melainabacteria bacterium]|nr:hypothetical protein [Candidatus Melainabacteria bacterium]